MTIRVVERYEGGWVVKEIGCAKHPTYQALRAPTDTLKHPRGCLTCWSLFARKAASDYRNRRRKVAL